jgi:hypothetical protein
MRVISDDALDDRPAPERKTVAEPLATVMRTTGFGDHLADTVRDLRSWMNDSERDWPILDTLQR